MSVMVLKPTKERAAESDVDWSQYFAPTKEGGLLRPDPKRRIPVEFRTEGNLILAGDIYRPQDAAKTELTPAVIMLGPISSVKEQTLPHYAERLADRGYTVLAFDSRSFGGSEGTPRHHYDPAQIIEDYSNAVSYMLTRSDVDRERIALVGVCMGGGFAISTAARDKRVKAVASVAGGYNVGGVFQGMLGVEGFTEFVKAINALRTKQYESGETQYIPTISHGPTSEQPLSVMPNEEAFSYYDRTSRTDAQTWLPNEMTAASLEPYLLYNAIAHAPLVSPTPLLVIHGTTDFVLLPEHAQQVYDAASEPKELVWIETHNHIELYDQDPYVSEAVDVLVQWLDAHLKETKADSSETFDRRVRNG